jgi:hypothetical protein
MIFAGHERGGARAFLIAPSTIYGVAHENPVHKTSQQVPSLVEAAIQKKQVCYIGKGTNLWSNGRAVAAPN